MKKYILTLLITFGTCNAYGAFDFENYVPTLGTNSAYTISFTSVGDDTAPNTITTYAVDYDDYVVTPLFYTYSISHNGATNNHLFVNSNTNPNIDESFILQTSSSGAGAIDNNGFVVNSITGDFISNSVEAALSAGAIRNFTDSTITSIVGDFIDNHASYGGAIFNMNAELSSVTGNFIGNHSIAPSANSVAHGGAIFNHGTINYITGDFIDNHSTSDAGAIYSDVGSTIMSITGNFIGNSADRYAGALYNKGSINSITGNFVSNSAPYGSAIINEGTIEFISGNFIDNNNGETAGGAIYTTQNIKFLSENDNYIISNNHGSGRNIGILAEFDGDDIDITFENKQNTSYTVNDEIAGWNQDSYTVSVTGDGTGYTAFNNNIGNVSNININNGKMVFGRTPDNYTGTAAVGHFESIPVMNLNNGTFDIANGYTEVITLNGITAVGNNNFLKLDLDIENNDSDVINVNGDISGQISVIISSLQDLDLENQIVWFANTTGNASSDAFVLSSVENLGYNLDIVFDSADKKWGIKKDGTNIPEQQPTLPTEVVQMADHISRTVTHVVQKLTNSMQKRVGELQWSLQDSKDDSDSASQSDSNNAFWTRGIYKNFDTNHTSIGLSGMEFGYDRIISSTESYKWYVGGLGYMSGGNSKFNDTNLDITGYGLGAYVMLLEKSGWFGDLVFRQHFIDIEDTGIKSDYSASSLNIEAGKEFVFGDNTDELNWFAKPSLEGTYITISGTDIGDYKVGRSTAQTLSLSVLGGPRWHFETGRKFQLYGKVGYILDNSDDIDVVVSGIGTKQTTYANTLETGIGFGFRGADNSTNLYLEASYITGTDYSEISGNLGLRYAF